MRHLTRWWPVLLAGLWLLLILLMQAMAPSAAVHLSRPIEPVCRPLGLLRSHAVTDVGQLCLHEDGTILWLPSDIRHRWAQQRWL